jgi:hypothetical protein
LFKLYVAYKQKSSLAFLLTNSVFTPPYSKKRFDKVVALWNQHPWLKEITSHINYVNADFFPDNPASSDNIFLFEEIENEFTDSYMNETPCMPFIEDVFIKKYITVFN